MNNEISKPKKLNAEDLKDLEKKYTGLHTSKFYKKEYLIVYRNVSLFGTKFYLGYDNNNGRYLRIHYENHIIGYIWLDDGEG